MTSIQSSLADPPGPHAEAVIIKQLIGKDLTLHQCQSDLYRPYFQYYSTECRRLNLGNSKETRELSMMAARTHEDILVIVRRLQLDKTVRRPEIRASLQQHFPQAEETSLNRSIDFALRVWLTMNVREACFKMHTLRTPTIQWDDVSNLSDFVARKFPRTTTAAVYLQLDHTLTAANIHRLSGINIDWTPCLADHLRFDNRKRLLKIYPFKQILLDHLQSCEALKVDCKKHPRTAIPETVLRETLLSLNLLFPHWDTLTGIFMLQHNQTFHTDGPFEDARTLNLADFDHWRNRLLELHQIFHSPPVGWTQIWADRRNPLQWYTFWIAIAILALTVVFGLIQSVTGILQTRLAYESVRLARIQLAIASKAGNV